jgi:hypothetical protein
MKNVPGRLLILPSFVVVAVSVVVEKVAFPAISFPLKFLEGVWPAYI